MAAERVISIDEESEVGRFIEQVEEQPIVVDLSGRRFRVVRDLSPHTEPFDEEAALQRFMKIFGIFKETDIDALLEEIRAQRGQDSVGRPADQ